MGLRYSNHKRYTLATSGMFVYLFEIIYRSEYPDYEYLSDYQNWTMEHIVNDYNDDESVSCIGNLLMLTKRLNGKCKSKNYKDKRKIYLESGFSWVRDYASDQLTKPTKKEIRERSNVIANKLARLLSFSIEEMSKYTEKTKKVKLFLRELEKDEQQYGSYLNDLKYDDYEAIQGKLKGKYKNQELLNLLN